MKVITYILSLFIILASISCEREPSITIIDKDGIGFNYIETNTTLSIKVSNGSIGIDNAEVRIGNNKSYTDENGIVIIENATRTDLGFTVIVSKSDYDTETLFIPYSGISEIDFIHREAVLNGNVNLQTFDNNSFFNSIELDEKFTVDIPADALVDRNGNIYNKNYTLEGYMISLNNQQQELSFPYIYSEGSIAGMLVSKYEFQILAKGNTGEQLSLAVGKTIGIEYKTVDPQLPSNVDFVNFSSVILDPLTGVAELGSLFSRDETVVSGSVSKLGKGYLGFSRSTIEVKCNLQTSNQEKLTYMPVRVSFDNSNFVTRTDAEGNLSIIAPKNVEISLSISLCGVETSKVLGVFDEDINLNSVTLDLIGTSIIGTAHECDITSSILGYLIVDGQEFGHVASDGNISGTWICDESYDGFLVYNTITGNSKLVAENLESQFLSIDLGTVVLGCSGGGFELCGQIRYDADDDGIAESNTEILNYTAGVVRLFEGAGNVISETVLDSDGNYCFEEVELGGTYEVELDLLDNVKFGDLRFYNTTGTKNYRGDTTLVFQRLVFENGVERVDFHFNDNVPGVVSGRVMLDTNSDGVGDTPFSNRSLSYYFDNNNDGVANALFSTKETDGNGNYIFTNIHSSGGIVRLDDVDNPSVTVIEEGDTSPEDGVDGSSTDTNGEIRVFLKRGESDENNDFTVTYETIVSENVSITGSVLIDNNGDESGDQGYAGEVLLLYLRGENGLPISNSSFTPMNTTSQFDGSYSFDNVPPGEYVIQSTGHFVDGVGSLTLFTRLSDKDESPEVGEPLDTDPPNGFIIINIEEDQVDADNNVVIRF